jgi:glycogen synthase
VTPLKVLMTADTFGGVWTYAIELAGALGELDVEIVLAAMGAPPSPSQAHAIARLRNVELVERSCALEWMPDAWPEVDDAGAWLLGLAAGADLVHVNGYAHAALPFEVPVVAVAHSCVLTWYRAVHGHDAPATWDEYRRRVAAGLAAADAVVAPTAAILRDVLAAHGVDVPAHVIPNGRTSSAWRPAIKAPVVVSAGRLWDEAKGLPELVACAPRVPWPIEVAGSTRHPDGSRVIAHGVHQLGELTAEELAARIGRASIYALPARYEPFGLSILEAALAGCALVIGDVDSLREVWGTAATYVRPGDADALADALVRLIEAPHRRRSLAAAARARALAFTPERMARSYRGLYDHLCSDAAEVCA